MKPANPVARQQAKPLTPEEEKELFIRSYMQKKAALAEGILFNMVKGEGRAMAYDIDSKSSEKKHLDMVKVANDMAEEFMRVVYRQDLHVVENEAKEEE